MRIRAIQWAAVDVSLKLVRSPFDTAIRMLPDLGTGARPAARAAVDAADTGVRAVVATVLGDRDAGDDAQNARPLREREERHAGRGRQSKSSAGRRSKEQHERAKEQGGRTRRESTRVGHEAAADQPRAPDQPTATPLALQAARERRARGAAIAGTANGTGRAPGSGSRRRTANLTGGEDQAPPASVANVSREPTHEEIAARAYELYERGVPGDAHSHWRRPSASSHQRRANRRAVRRAHDPRGGCGCRSGLQDDPGVLRRRLLPGEMSSGAAVTGRGRSRRPRRLAGVRRR